MTLYQISGLGAGVEVYSEINPNCKVVFIPWLQPNKNETIQNYARRMSKKIDTNEVFSLMGVSFGGIMIQEIAKFLEPKNLFVISSVLERKEIPQPMRIASKLGLTSKIPKFGINKAKGFTNYLFGAKRDKDKAFLSKIMDKIDVDYLRWSLTQIGNWKGDAISDKVIRFHGKKDLLFPTDNLKNVNYWLKGGHLASITDGKKISKIVNEVLAKTS
jgi:hypothetical protein